MDDRWSDQSDVIRSFDSWWFYPNPVPSPPVPSVRFDQVPARDMTVWPHTTRTFHIDEDVTVWLERKKTNKKQWEGVWLLWWRIFTLNEFMTALTISISPISRTFLADVLSRRSTSHLDRNYFFHFIFRSARSNVDVTSRKKRSNSSFF